MTQRPGLHPGPNPRRTVPYLEGQLAALQTKHNRTMNALRLLGYDADAIAEGTVEVGLGEVTQKDVEWAKEALRGVED